MPPPAQTRRAFAAVGGPPRAGKAARTAAAPGRARATRRDEILARAVDLASEEGLEGLTIGRLASELEMSKSGLFGHFGSKQELQLATVDAAARRFAAEVIEPSLGVEEGEERLRALCDRYLEHVERRVYPGGCFWAAVATEFDARPGAVRDEVRERVGAWLAVLERQAELAGVRDAGQLAFELHAIVQGANSTYQLFGDEQSFARARAALAERLPGAEKAR